MCCWDGRARTGRLCQAKHTITHLSQGRRQLAPDHGASNNPKEHIDACGKSRGRPSVAPEWQLTCSIYNLRWPFSARAANQLAMMPSRTSLGSGVSYWLWADVNSEAYT
jgi:hypothetical protein